MQRSQNNSNNVSIIKDTNKNENIVEQEDSQNNKNERIITNKNDASNNILKDLEKKQKNASQNNIEKEIENLKSNFENKERKAVSRNNEMDIQSNNPNNISFAENDKADINLNDDLIKNKLINNFNKKNNQNNLTNNNNLHHYKTVNIVNNKNMINDVSAEMHNYQNTDHSKNQENSSILNTNSVNNTNPNANTLQQSNPNIQLHNKNQNLKNSKFIREEINNNNNNNLIISNYIHKNPIENKNQPGFSLKENNNNYQSTLIPLNQQQPLVVVINNTILSDNRKDEDLGKIKNNYAAVSEDYNATNNHALNDKQLNFTQIKTDLTEEGSQEKSNYLMKNSENNSNNIKLNTFVNNVPFGKENNNHYLSNKISYNFGILEQAKKITLNSNFKVNSNNQETNKNTLLSNYNNFVVNNKNKNSSANNTHIPSGNTKINPSFINSSLNQSVFNNKDYSENTSLNKNLNAHNVNNSRKPKNFENFNNYVLSESIKNKIFKNHFQEKYFQNEQNKSNEKKYNQETNSKPPNTNLIQKNKTSIEKELLSSNKFSTKPRIQNLSLKINEIKKDKDTKTINIDLNNKNLNSNKTEFIRINKVEKTQVTNTNAGLNFANNPNLNRELKNLSINEKAQDSQLINSEVNTSKNNPKMNLRTTFFSQLKNNENNIKKANRAQNPNSYLSTLNDKDEKHRNPPNKQLTNTISKITENYYMHNLKQINNQDSKKIGTPSNLITKNINYNENSNSLNDKNPSPMKDSSLSKNKNISKEKDAISVNNKLYLNNLVNPINKSVHVTDTNSSQFIHNKLDKSKLSFAAKNNTNLTSLLKFGLTNNILSTSSKINLKKNILTASTASKHSISNLKNSQNFTNNISSNTKITHDNIKNSSIINLNQSKNSIINTKEATAAKHLLNQSRNQISGLSNKFKNTNMNNFTNHINNESEDNHMKLTKDLAGNHTNNSIMNNKIKFNKVFNNIQSGVIDLNAPNKNATYDHPNSNDSIPNLLINNKLPRKSNTNNINNLSINSNSLLNKVTNNSNMNHYLTNQNNNSRFNGLNSEYSIESGNSKNKFLTNASNYSSLNQRTISENTDNSQNTIINNKYANNGVFKSVKTFISNESGLRSESMNYSNLDSRGNSRSKSKASDKTTSTIFYYNNTNGYKSDASEQNLNFHNFSNNIRSGDESDNTNSAINLKKFNKNSFNFNELKKKLQIKELDNSTSFHNSSLNRSGNNNTIKEGNSFTDNLDCKIIDIKEDYDQSSNPSGNLNHVKSNTNNKYNINSINNINANNKKSVIELNKEEIMKKNLLNQNRNIEFMRTKIK